MMRKKKKPKLQNFEEIEKEEIKQEEVHKKLEEEHKPVPVVIKVEEAPPKIEPVVKARPIGGFVMPGIPLGVTKASDVQRMEELNKEAKAKEDQLRREQ